MSGSTLSSVVSNNVTNTVLVLPDKVITRPLFSLARPAQAEAGRGLSLPPKLHLLQKHAKNSMLFLQFCNIF